MSRRILKYQLIEEIKPKSEQRGEISISDFLTLYEEFIKQKSLEGLRERTLRDYQVHYKYLKEYMEAEHRSIVDRCLEIDVVRAYIFYMQEEKQLSAFTIF